MADRLTIEHYIGEAFVKCGQVILGSRILPSVSPPKARTARDTKRAGRWFLLELDDIDGVSREVEQWRKDISSPLVVEIIMTRNGASSAGGRNPQSLGGPVGPGSSGVSALSGGGADRCPPSTATLLERWTLQYERTPPPGSSSSMGDGSSGAMGPGGAGTGAGSGTRTYLDDVSVYKRLTILVRSLYSYTRVLPAFKIFRAAKRHQGDSFPLQLQSRIYRTLQPQAAPAASSPPAPRLQDFMFAPVDTPGGRFRIAVQHNPAAANLVVEQHHSSTAPVAMPFTIDENYLGADATGLHPAPGTSAPVTGGAARSLRHAMSASVYGTRHSATGRSPPSGTGGGILRQAPSSGTVSGVGTYGIAPAMAADAGGPSAPPRVIVRQSWSSKDMKVSFSLPPPMGSPGGLGLGGGGAGISRRSSSGYGSTPPTPPLPSPVSSGRPPGSHASPAVSGSTSAAAPSAVAGSTSHSYQRQQSYPHSQHPYQHHQHPAYQRCGSVISSNSGTTPPTAPPPSRPPPSGPGPRTSATAASAAVPHPAPATAASNTLGAASMSAFAAPALQQQQPKPPPLASVTGDDGDASTEGAAAVRRGSDDGSGESGHGGGAAAAAAATGGGGTDRTSSAPVAIPARSSSRTRSVNDLRAPAVYGGFEVHPAVAAAAVSSRNAAAAAAATAVAAAAAAGGAAGDVSADTAAATAAAAHHRMAPGSAPAAPRGMLGLALGAAKPGAGGGKGTAAAQPADATAAGDAAGREPVELPSPTSTAPAAATAQGSEGGAGSGSRTSQALAVVQPHHRQQHHNCLRPPSVPYSVVPGGSPPPHMLPMGLLPPYGSPQLPFAFTPSVHSMSLASLHQAMLPPGCFGGHGGGGPSGGGPRVVSGRDITCLATIRRPSWSSRSGSLDPSLASVGAAGPLLPSLSPLNDDDLLESPFSNSSTPGGPGTRPGSSSHNRNVPHPTTGHSGRSRRRHPSSSSASAIFSLSPSSAVPGSSPPSASRSRTSCKGAAAAAATATIGDELSGGGTADDDGMGQKHSGKGTPGAATASPGGAQKVGGSGSGRVMDAAAAETTSIAANETAAAAAHSGPMSGGAGAGQLPYDPYGPYCDPEADLGLCPLAREDSESDLLPFALDQDGLLLDPGVGAGAPHLGSAAAAAAAAAAALAGRQGQPAAGLIELALSITQPRERDVAVGAFVRMMAEAAPLAAHPDHPAARELSGRQALSELEQLGRQIRAALTGPYFSSTT